MDAVCVLFSPVRGALHWILCRQGERRRPRRGSFGIGGQVWIDRRRIMSCRSGTMGGRLLAEARC